MTRLPPVYRIEAPGEVAVPFPSLVDAMRSAPGSLEAQVVTSVDGVVLAEAQRTAMVDVRFRWRPTVAGLDVISGSPRSIERACA